MIVREADSLEEKLFHFSIQSSKEDKKLFSLVFLFTCHRSKVMLTMRKMLKIKTLKQIWQEMS